VRIGADTGGTFTDVVADDGRIAKVPSDRDRPDAAVAAGVATLAAGTRPSGLAHGTTVATNALLERELAPVVLVTNEGMADLIEIGRQDRPSLYDHTVDRPPPLVPRERRIEVRGRLDADGAELVPVDPSGLAAALPPDGPVAVVLLHADRSPVHELAVAAALPGRDVTCSHEVSPEFREYERTVTTVVNAGLRPRCADYLTRLADLADDVSVLSSAGGLLPVPVAAARPAALLLSGPAGGVRAAAAAAVANGYPDAVSFDMGGTSTDVCLVLAGEPAATGGFAVGGYPVRFPATAIHTIGAGGGSIAVLDPGGALVVGPASAGADPGPACYGRGGTRPTVTDADLVLGRIPSGASFGPFALDVDAARRALGPLDAGGILRVVDANMERAVRAVSVGRGVDPRNLALVAFGGAGPLHAVALADALDMPAVIVPARAGVLSAVGLLTAPPEREVVRSYAGPLDGVPAALAELTGGDPSARTFVDCRYVGQSYELTVERIEHFAAEHDRRFGYARPGRPVEVIAVRARFTGTAATTIDALGVPPHRATFTAVPGPAVIPEPDSTIWVPDGWIAEPGAAGAIVVRRR
jgi:N-methylhydantoinase A/oxoprolinase/acetone carboxylase beta subunit